MSDNNKYVDDGKPEKTVTIIVNGNNRKVPDGAQLGAAQLVKLAFDNPPTGDLSGIAITYRRGRSSDSEALLREGEKVTVKDGMVFNVVRTDKS